MFQHRSGRVVAFGRAALAAFFLLAIWLDPTQPAQAAEETYALLIVYLLVSVVALAVTWNSWWLECRLAAPLHIGDLLVFLALVFTTEGYTSPFFTFFVFLILSATIRWGWRVTALTAGAVILLFVLAGITSESWGTETFDLRRFVIRSAYILVLSMILMWFGLNQRALRREFGRVGDLAEITNITSPPVKETLEYVARRFLSPRIVFVWWETEEPWINVASFDKGEVEEQRFGPGTFCAIVADDLQGSPFLFDRKRRHVLTMEPERRRQLLKDRDPLDLEFAERFGLRRGLAIPMKDERYAGELFVLKVPGLCSDDLKIAQLVSAEVSAAFERVALFEVTEDNASSRARLALARDLHDSVLQFLAGLSFKLEGIRKSVVAGRESDSEIDALQRELSQEQQDLRGVISQLRGGRAMGRGRDLSASIADLCDRASRQWSVKCTMRSEPGAIEAPARLEYDLRHLVREAIANAARHGRAQKIAISLRAAEDILQLEIADDGSGFPAKAGFGDGELQGERTGPWSLSERVKNLGGTLMLYSGSRGSRVTLTIPLGEQS